MKKEVYIFFCGLADNVRLVDDKMHTQSAHSALVDICRIAKWLFSLSCGISYALTEWYILFLWVHQAVMKIGKYLLCIH